jgi:hypothetical protein
MGFAYLGIPNYFKGTILQLLDRQVRQDIGNIPSNVSPGCEGNLRVAIATDGHFPARDIKLQVSELLLTE